LDRFPCFEGVFDPADLGSSFVFESVNFLESVPAGTWVLLCRDFLESVLGSLELLLDFLEADSDFEPLALADVLDLDFLALGFLPALGAMMDNAY